MMKRSILSLALWFGPGLAVADAPVQDRATGVVDVIPAEPSSEEFPDSLRREAQAVVDRTVAWLEAGQYESGSWSNAEFPALTGLPVWGLAIAGHADSETVKKGVKYILSCTRDDGSIWREPSEKRKGGGLPNYNTAICMVALHAVKDPSLEETILAARRYVAGGQHEGNDVYRGGMGYDPDTGRAYADLSNSYIGYEAMALTSRLKEMEDEHASADLDWAAATAFVASLQNDDGGFIYKPGHSMAGAETNESGEVQFRSYGSMTYAGLLSLIYAQVDDHDPRIQSAFDWAVHHWTLDENPGMGAEGIYYFYNILSKSLAIYGQDRFTTPSGSSVNWRAALTLKLISLQKIDPESGAGYWVNDQGRWWENDPVLATSYALIALQIALSD